MHVYLYADTLSNQMCLGDMPDSAQGPFFVAIREPYAVLLIKL